MEAMTEHPNPDREALDRLSHALIDDILNTSDEEVLAEFRESGGDSSQHADEMRALLEQSILTANKQRLAAARAGAAARSAEDNAPAAQIDITEARKQLRT